MKKELLFILPLALMACSDDSSSVTAVDGASQNFPAAQTQTPDKDKLKSSSSFVFSSSSMTCPGCGKGYFVNAKYPVDLGERPVSDSMKAVTPLDKFLEYYGVDGLAFDTHVVSALSLSSKTYGFMLDMESELDYAPFLSEIPDSLAEFFIPAGTELRVTDCKHYLLGYSAMQQPFAYVVTSIAKDTVDIVSVVRSPKEGFSCRSDNAIVQGGFLIEDCGDVVVPDKDFVVRWSTKESPLWTCDTSVPHYTSPKIENEPSEESSCAIVCSGGGGRESRCDTTCSE
ncbi:MAG: hypothetical protein II850_04500 [Fibrobacter sp.]|nr:hypothetical protein [Fibrobacter sp.]